MTYAAIIYFSITTLFGLKYAKDEWKSLFKCTYDDAWNWRDYVFFPLTFGALVLCFSICWPIILMVEYKERRKRRGR